MPSRLTAAGSGPAATQAAAGGQPAKPGFHPTQSHGGEAVTISGDTAGVASSDDRISVADGIGSAVSAIQGDQPTDLSRWIRDGIDPLGGVDLPLPEREPIREPPVLDA